MKYKYVFETGEIEEDLIDETSFTTFEFEKNESIADLFKRIESEFPKADHSKAIDKIELFQDESELDLETFEIKHWVSNRSFGELKSMFEEGEIIIPDMQRSFVWSPSQCSKLIESIILGFPIPPLFLMEVDRNKYEVIDGLQRLTTISNYMLGRPWGGKTNSGKKGHAAKLSGKISAVLKGKKFSDLSNDHQQRIKRSTIPLIEFKQYNPDDMTSKFLIFERINTGSQKLSPMQVRKALFHGKFLTNVYAATEVEVVKNFTKDKLTNSQQKTDELEELILRGITLYFLKNEELPYSRSIKEMIDATCDRERQNEEISKGIIEVVLLKMAEIEKLVKNQDDFLRTLKKDGTSTNRLNRNIFDAMFANILDKILNDENVNVESVANRYENAVRLEFEKENSMFMVGTNNESVIKSRISFFEEMLK